MVSPFAVRQQQLSMLAQQQSLLMAAAAQATNGASKPPANMQQSGLNGTNMPAQNWANLGYQIPGLTMPLAGQNEVEKLVQVKIPCSIWIVLLFVLTCQGDLIVQFVCVEQIGNSQSMHTAGSPPFPAMG